jgi:hypothetical protein
VVGSVSVSLEQDAPVEQLSGVSPAAAYERFELGALFFGEADDVFLVDGEITPVLVRRPRGYTSSSNYATKL